MGYTITQKILAAHAQTDGMSPGDIVNVDVDLTFGTDASMPLTVLALKQMGVEKILHPERIALINDHFVPAKDAKAAGMAKIMRDFADHFQIKNYFEVGRGGICHVLLPEKGLVKPGEVIIGADSHTCSLGAFGSFATGVGSTDLAATIALGQIWLRVPETIKVIYRGALPEYVEGKDLMLRTLKEIRVDGARYQAIEYVGETIRSLPMHDRFTMVNMSVEAGAKNGIMEVDEITEDYLASRVQGASYTTYTADADATYSRIVEIDASSLSLQVAIPFSPDNVLPIEEVEPVAIQQVFIGSCTNGQYEDLERAAEIIKGHQVHRSVRLIVIPNTQESFHRALKGGLINIFVEAGASVNSASCGPCFGGHLGVLGKGERCIATTNRNFHGRMGHNDAEVYLTNPRVAAASALPRHLTDPRTL